MQKRRRIGLELGLYTEEREGKRAAAGVEIANDGHDTGGFDLNSMGALKGGNGRKLRREAALVLRYVFKRGLMAGARGKAGKRPSGRDCCDSTRSRGEPEVEGGADGRAPLVSEKREGGRGGAGRAGAPGPEECVGPAVCKERRKGRGEMGWRAPSGRKEVWAACE
jgi:hypothetical protein